MEENKTMYYRNKFDEEFLFLANEQPKGASIRLDQSSEFFQIIKQNNNTNKTTPNSILVIPLILYNKIHSSNPNDKIIDDYLAICRPLADTQVTALYDEEYNRSIGENTYGTKLVTGDFVRFEDDELLLDYEEEAEDE